MILAGTYLGASAQGANLSLSRGFPLAIAPDVNAFQILARIISQIKHIWLSLEAQQPFDERLG
jgi:hypothetical protein